MVLETLLVIGVYKLLTSKKNTVKTETKQVDLKPNKGNLVKADVLTLETNSGIKINVPETPTPFDFVLPPKDVVQTPQIAQSPDLSLDASIASTDMTQSGIYSIKTLT